MTILEVAVPTEAAARLQERLAAAERALAEEVRRADALNRIAAAIGASTDLQAVVQAVSDGGVELTGAEFGAFFYNVLDAAGESYTLYTLSGAPASAFERFPQPRNTPVFAPTFNGEGVIRSDDITKDPRYGTMSPHRGMPKGHLPVCSYLAVPVIDRSGEVLGGLFFGHSRPAQFSERHQVLVEGIAAQAAVAIENARLNEQRTRAEAALADSQARFELIANTIPSLCWMSEADGQVIWYNRRWYEYTGLAPDDLLGTGWRSVVHPDHAEEAVSRRRRSLATGEPFEMLAPIRGADQCYRLFLVRIEPAHDAMGRITRWFGVGLDVTAETSALERLQFALDAGRLGSWELDVATRAYVASDQCKANYGRQPHEPFGFGDLLSSIHPDDRPQMETAIEEAIRTGGAYDIEYRIVDPTGQVRWVHARGRAAQTADQGGVRRMAGVSLDITERKRAEERQALLLNELNHRVKNTLASVQSIASQTLRYADGPKAFRDAFEARLLALSKTHNLLTAESWTSASLQDILTAELAPHAGPTGAGQARFTLQADRDVRLSPKAAVALGMAVHELATNALKYGALSSPSGHVAIRTQVSGRGRRRTLELEWRERGGPAVSPPTRRGFGGRLLQQGLATELSGEVHLDYDPAGVTCRMTLPLQGLEPAE
jgi:PAS domain S-box-containing protein